MHSQSNTPVSETYNVILVEIFKTLLCVYNISILIFHVANSNFGLNVSFYAPPPKDAI